ncbi:hypothetical protein TNCV_2127511 [Trichonephila clavipes]|nr:hypothetical protein TNCV_2127511 [Trichonephila clavipes]
MHEFEPSTSKDPPCWGVMLKRPPDGVVVRTGRCQLRRRPRYLTMVQNDEMSKSYSMTNMDCAVGVLTFLYGIFQSGLGFMGDVGARTLSVRSDIVCYPSRNFLQELFQDVRPKELQ